MATIIQLRNDTSSNWTTYNPILAEGELGIETDTKKFKIGNGVNSWSNLSYFKSGNVDSVNGQTGVVTITIDGLTTQIQMDAINSGANTTNIGQITTNKNAIGTLSNLSTTEKSNLVGAINEVDSDVSTNTGAISTINSKIPNQATSSNQLADKAFVNSTVQTGTANFRGNWNNWTTVPTNADDYPVDYAGSKTPTVNDYLVVQDASDYTLETLEGTWRFKYSGEWDTNGKNGWLPEYQVNETPLTAAQLAALNSGATTTNIGQITTNQNNIGNLSTLTTTANTNLVSAINEVDSIASGKQDPMSAGTGISISSNTISVTSPTLTNTSTATNSLSILSTGTAMNNGVNIGTGSSLQGAYSIAIGPNSTAGWGSIGIGAGTRFGTGSYGGVCIGYLSFVGNTTGTTAAAYATAIGNGAIARGNAGIQLGYGENTQAKTLSVGFWDTTPANWTLLDGTTGKIPAGRYTNFIGSDGTNAGTAGAVPAPTATDNTNFLKGDGTWSVAIQGVKTVGTELTPGSDGKVNIPAMTSSVYGVAKVWEPYGIKLLNGTLILSPASNAEITGKTNAYRCIAPSTIDKAASVIARSIYDKSVAITSGAINIDEGSVFYTDSPSAATTYTISTSATTQSGLAYRYFNVLINMPSTAVGIDFTTNNSVTWTEDTTPDMSTGGRTYLLAFQSFDGGTSWIGSLATWWTTPTP